MRQYVWCVKADATKVLDKINEFTQKQGATTHKLKKILTIRCAEAVGISQYSIPIVCHDATLTLYITVKDTQTFVHAFFGLPILIGSLLFAMLCSIFAFAPNVFSLLSFILSIAFRTIILYYILSIISHKMCPSNYSHALLILDSAMKSCGGKRVKFPSIEFERNSAIRILKR